MKWFGSKKEERLPEIPVLSQINLPSAEFEISPNQSFNESQVSRQDNFHREQLGSGQPFFVRVDKFSDAKKALIGIEKKLNEMESVLAKLQNVKQKEEEEMESWKQDMKEVKSYLDEVNSSVFNYL